MVVNWGVLLDTSIYLTMLSEKTTPGTYPRLHDVRKHTVSLAWPRGVQPSKIISSAFWMSSNNFISRYLKPPVSDTQPCVALDFQ